MAKDTPRKPGRQRPPSASPRSRKSSRGDVRDAALPGEPVPRDAESPWVLMRSFTLHPFIYRRMLAAADPQARAGDVVNVYDRDQQFFGRGLYNPRSQIAVRILTHGDEAIDEAFWQRRLHDAIRLRAQLGIARTSDAYRLVHSEGDGLSGLIVERYADCLVFEVFSLGMEQRLPLIGRQLQGLLGQPGLLDNPQHAAANWRIFIRADEQIERIEGFRIEPPAAPPRIVVREHGIRYQVDVAAGHKTGFFCDQRDNRLRLARFCGDAEVLDVCCYTGGFGLAAKLLGKARDVTGVDLDESAIAVAQKNANLNQARIRFVQADAFNYLRQMINDGRQFDVVVLDPPKLCPTRADMEEAQRKYHDLNKLGFQVVRPGGLLLTCSCSGLVSRDQFLQIVHGAARRAGRRAQLFNFCGAAPDHPVMLDCPESAYLKVAWLRVLERGA